MPSEPYGDEGSTTNRCEMKPDRLFARQSSHCAVEQLWRVVKMSSANGTYYTVVATIRISSIPRSVTMPKCCCFDI